MLLQAGVDGLSTITTLLPVLLAVWLVADTLAMAVPLAVISLEPRLLLDGLLARVTSTGFLFPVLGLAASGAVLTGVLRIFYLAGALGVFAADLEGGDLERRSEEADEAARAEVAPSDRTFMDNSLARFPAGIGVGVLAGFAGLLWGAWSVGLVASGVTLYAAGAEGSGAAAFGGASALALALSLFLGGALLYELVLRITLARALVLGDRPLVAFYEAGRLVLRRFGTVLAVLFTVAVLQLMLSFTLSAATAPLALLPPEAAGTGFAVAARIVAWILRLVALGWLAVLAHAAFTAFVLDDAGRLPPPPPVPVMAAPPIPATRALVARPVGPMAPARPVVTARPIRPRREDGPDDAG